MTTRLLVRDLTCSFGGLRAVDHLDLEVRAGEFVSVIGPNGAGKTTLFNIVAGLVTPDLGTVHLDGRDVTGLPPEKLAAFGLARTFQHGRVFGNLSVMDNVLVGSHSRLAAVRPKWAVGGALAELALALVQPRAVAAEETRLRAEAREILALFGDRLLPRQDQRAFSLSYANRRRVEIARALSAKPKLLMMDEPTAGMNPTETLEMLEIIEALKRRGQTIVIIEHKLELIMQLSDRVVVMDSGRKIADGPPAAVASDPRVIEAYLGHGAVGAAAPAQEHATP